MKDKKGFTLVELLITIALIVSILSIAILGFSKISEKQKENAWEEVKDQIELAAEQYINVNEYLIKDLKEYDNVFIPIEKLVESDHLTILTDPKTGKQLNGCDVVKIGKDKTIEYLTKDEAVKYLGNDYDSAGCSFEPLVVDTAKITTTRKTTTKKVTTTTAKKLDTNLTITLSKNISDTGCEAGPIYKRYTFTSNAEYTTDWFNGLNYANGVVIDITTNDNSNFKLIYSDLITGSYNDIYNNRKTICAKQDQNNGKLSVVFGENKTATVNLNIDRTKPFIKVDVDGSDKWNNTKLDTLYYYYEMYDTTSGLASYQRFFNKSNLTYDEANLPANSWDKSKNSYASRDGNAISNLNEPFKHYNVKDKNTLADGWRKFIFKACDIAGNCAYSNEAIVGIDTADIVVDLIMKKKSSNATVTSSDYKTSDVVIGNYTSNKWYNKYVFVRTKVVSKGLSKVTVTCSDTRTNGKNYSNFKTYRNVNTQGTTTFNCTGVNEAGTKSKTISRYVKLDRVAPKIKYITGPIKQECGGNAGVYIKYQVSDELSGVSEVYHFYGQDPEVKTYAEVSKYNILVKSFSTEGNKGPYIIERNWAVGNPEGCGSENESGPNTSWCYRNNSAVKDYAGNTATGISSTCSKVGK